MTESEAYSRQKIFDTKLSAPLSNWQIILTIVELRHYQIEAVEAEEMGYWVQNRHHKLLSIRPMKRKSLQKNQP